MHVTGVSIKQVIEMNVDLSKEMARREQKDNREHESLFFPKNQTEGFEGNQPCLVPLFVLKDDELLEGRLNAR